MPKQTFFNLPTEKRQAIIDIALDEFAENDYRTASISRVVAKANIAKGSFYQYFANKKDLYLYLIDLGLQEKGQFLQATPPPDPAMGTFPYLRWLFQEGVRFGFSNPRLTRVAYRAFFDDQPFHDETIEQAKTASGDFFRQLFAQGIDRGDIDPDIDVESAVFLFNMIFMELGTYIMTRLDIDPQQLDTQGVALFDDSGAVDIYNKFIDMLEFGIGVKN